MKTRIKILLAVLVMIGVAYWAFVSVWPSTYSGSSIMFPVGKGAIVVTNTGSEAIPIEMRTEERAASFRVVSAEIGLSESATRQGSGRTAYYTVSFELPPSQTTLYVTRGNNVYLISRSDTRIEATVTPMSASATRNVVMAAVAALALGLYYISRVTEHRWVSALRNKLTKNDLQQKETTA